MNNNKINESLLENDLKWLVYDEIMLDMHKSKLGDDQDYVVVAIAVKDQKPATDLANFIEHGTSKFEDVEVSPATDDLGRYLVYVELVRSPEMFDSVLGILTDAARLSGIETWKFKHHKDQDAVEFNQENFSKFIKTSPEDYKSIGDPEVVESVKERYRFLLNY